MDHKTTQYLTLLLLLLMSFVSCSKKQTSKQVFTFQISAFTSNGHALDGGSFVQATSNGKVSIIKLDADNSASFPPGIWEFQAVSFEGPTPFAGRKYCGGAVGVNLGGAEQNVALNITEANCLSVPFVSLIAEINNIYNSTILTVSSSAINFGPITGGTLVTISGSGFMAGAIVEFDASVCSGPTVVSSTSITCTTPAHATGAVNIKVTNTDSQFSIAPSAFTYVTAPTVTSVSLSAGPIAGLTNVTITGTGFFAGATVTFGGSVCTIPLVVNATSITCTTPAHAAGAVAVAVTNADTQSGSSVAFTYRAAPTVTGVAPNSGLVTGGSAVTITGTGFVTGITATFGGVACTAPTYVNSTSMTCITPAHAAGAVGVAVTNTDTQSGSTASAYTYQAAAPSVTSVSFNTGSLAGGTIVTINGSNFISGATVDFDGSACTTVIFVNTSSLTCTTPAHATGSVTVTVINPDSQSGVAVGAYHYKQSFISTWRTTAANESVSLPLRAGYTYNFTVDWGDGSAIGTVTSDVDADKNHTYAAPGNYTVTLNGSAQAWYFNNAGSKLKIIAVTNFGDMGWINLSNAFFGCSNLVSFAGGKTASVTDMSFMFGNATGLTSLNLTSFKTAAVTNMSGMFINAHALTTLDLSSFETAMVTNMSSMFEFASGLTGLDFTLFNTAMVTDMSGMFSGATALTNLDLSYFNTAAVTNMSIMFNGDSGLNSLNLTTFNTAAVTNMFAMFSGTSGLTGLDFSSFNTAAVTDMSQMFYGASGLTTLDLSSFTTAAVTNMSQMFSNTSALTTLNTTGWNLAPANASTNVFTGANAVLIVTCNQGGSPASGIFFGKNCN